MATNSNFKPIGGIASAELLMVKDLKSRSDLITKEGIKVELSDYASHYDESFLSDNGLVSVKHTLTLVAAREDAAAWIDAEFLRNCAADGVVAKITLSTGENLTIGWSKKMLFEQALRLQALTCSTGTHPKHRPRIELVLSCCDVCSAYNKG